MAASSGGPVDLFVDTAELDRLRPELQTLQTELGDLPARTSGDADSGALGRDVAGAADRFTAHWNDGRARITDNLGECRTLTDGATQAYTSAETTIRNATPPPSGPANPETP